MGELASGFREVALNFVYESQRFAEWCVPHKMSYAWWTAMVVRAPTLYKALTH